MDINRIENLRNLLREDPEDAFLNYALALELTKIGKYKEAADLHKEILAKDNDYLAVYYQLGNLYEMMGEPEQAKSIYKDGIRLAKSQNKLRTLNELKTALTNLDTEFDDAE